MITADSWSSLWLAATRLAISFQLLNYLPPFYLEDFQQDFFVLHPLLHLLRQDPSKDLPSFAQIQPQGHHHTPR